MIIAIPIILIALTSLFFWYYAPLNLWYEAKLSGVNPGIWNMVRMRLQNIPHKLIISTLVKAKNSNLKLLSEDLMQKYLAGVDIEKVADTAIQAINAGIDVSYNELARQYLAKVDIERVIHSLISLHNAGINISLEKLSSYYLSNVDVVKVTDALISAHNAGYKEITYDILKEHYLSNGDVIKTVNAYISVKDAKENNVTFNDIASIDLTDIDVKEATNWYVNPTVIETQTITGIAGDGIELHMKLKLTLRANLKNMIGGATEQTVFAKVNESLATEIGSSSSHHNILKDPYKLANNVQKRELGKGSAFDILSIDVSEVKVGKDIHAGLLTERAKANAERAKTEYIKAEEKVQKAMAAAFMDGNLSIHDYHKIQNTEADTEMRKKIGKSVSDDDLGDE